ncbi:hypothetical protein AVEN_11644-1 [Araneus ventricosus]|uniref:Uncharacterized protein n=1 Tax=Araneus ventricosus TaxID=182803 RepID=A0A4Y2HGB2_ARAVE|nr:hypothetical protein AVEN_11644-1 [Araneus ventricosus]
MHFGFDEEKAETKVFIFLLRGTAKTSSMSNRSDHQSIFGCVAGLMVSHKLPAGLQAEKQSHLLLPHNSRKQYSKEERRTWDRTPSHAPAPAIITVTAPVGLGMGQITWGREKMTRNF